MILIDTTPLVALCDPRDGLHARALADVDKVGKRGFVVCAPVLTEACFLLAHPVQRQRLERLLTALCVVPLVIDDESAFWGRVFRWLARYAEHEPDWADACLVVASGVDKRLKIWTYDNEFRTTWRREDGTRIALAVTTSK